MPPRPIQRVLILRAGRLGDCVFASALMDAVDAVSGGACSFDWFLPAPLATLFEHDNRVHHVFSMSPRQKKLPLLLSPDKRKVAAGSKKTPYDLVINLETDSFFDELMSRIRAAKKIGTPFTTKQSNEKDHHVIRGCNVLQPLGYTYENHPVFPKLFGNNFEFLAKKFTLKRPYIVVSAAVSATLKRMWSKKTSSLDKIWPKEYWRELIYKIDRNYNCAIVLTGTRNDRRALSELLRISDATVDLFGKTSASELITLVGNAALTITADTGTCHVATATKSPLIALYGPTDWRTTGPFEPDKSLVKLLSVKLENPYTPYNPNVHDKDAMREIKPDMVMAAVRDLLPTNGRNGSATGG